MGSEQNRGTQGNEFESPSGRLSLKEGKETIKGGWLVAAKINAEKRSWVSHASIAKVRSKKVSE